MGLSLSVPKLICDADFEAYLLALSGYLCNSVPFKAHFLEILMQKGDCSKVPYLPFFDFESNKGLSEFPLYSKLC